MAARCGGSRLQDGTGSCEDSGRALVRDFLFCLEVMLNVPTAKCRAFEAKRLAANQSDRLRLNFADLPRGLFAVNERFRCGVPEDNVGLCSGTHKPTYVVSAVM